MSYRVIVMMIVASRNYTIIFAPISIFQSLFLRRQPSCECFYLLILLAIRRTVVEWQLRMRTQRSKIVWTESQAESG